MIWKLRKLNRKTVISCSWFQAGPGIDAAIKPFFHLDKGDILIDGDTFYKDIRRNEKMANSGINFIGAGVSGGEKKVPMRSFNHAWWARSVWLVADVLERNLCKRLKMENHVWLIGPWSKTVTTWKWSLTGSEYGDKLIAENLWPPCNTCLVFLQKTWLKSSQMEQGWWTATWSKSLRISWNKDDEGQDRPIVDYILDAAGNKGTGKWTSQSALDGACHCHSSLSQYLLVTSAHKKKNDVHASKVLPKPAVQFRGDKAELIENSSRNAYFSKSSLTLEFAQCVLLRK